jgi:hypothetical protein
MGSSTPAGTPACCRARRVWAAGVLGPWALAAGPVHLLARGGQQRGQQGEGDGDADGGTSMPPIPMDRSAGTGSTISDSRLMATVMPL